MPSVSLGKKSWAPTSRIQTDFDEHLSVFRHTRGSRACPCSYWQGRVSIFSLINSRFPPPRKRRKGQPDTSQLHHDYFMNHGRLHPSSSPPTPSLSHYSTNLQPMNGAIFRIFSIRSFVFSKKALSNQENDGTPPLWHNFR